MRHRALGLLPLVILLTQVTNAQSPTPRPIVIATKPFGESFILGEIFAQLLERRGFKVDRRPGLGATEVIFSGVKSGAVDVYPEYTGTGLLAILHEDPITDPSQVYQRVSREFKNQFGIRCDMVTMVGALARTSATDG